MPDKGEASAIRATRCDTSATKCATSAARRHECDTSENFDFDNDTSKNIFSHPYIYFTIWKKKDCKERNNFILRTTFWKSLVSMPKSFKKCTTKTKLFNGKSCINSERTFEIKERLRWTVSKFCLRQQLFAFKEFRMETRLSNVFKTTNVTNLTKLHPNRKH